MIRNIHVYDKKYMYMIRNIHVYKFNRIWRYFSNIISFIQRQDKKIRCL